MTPAAPPAASPVRLSWRPGPDLPAFLKGGAMGVVGGRVVYAGGMAYPWREAEGVWYQDDGGAWQPGPALPLGRAYTEGVSVRDGLVVVGGRRSGPEGRLSLADAWWLRPGAADSEPRDWRWQRLPDLAQARAVASLATDGRHILAVGGGVWEGSQGGAFATRDVDRCELLDLDELERGWRDAGPAPLPTRSSAACAGLRGAGGTAGGEGVAYLLGGYECWTEAGQRQVRRLRDAWRFDFAAGTWRRLDDLPGYSSGACAAAVAPGCVALLGGLWRWERDGVEVDHAVAHTRDAGTARARHVGGYSDLVWLYDTAAGRWTLQPEPLPTGVNDHRCAVVDGRVWVAGGETVDPALSNTTERVAVADIEEAGGNPRS